MSKSLLGREFVRVCNPLWSYHKYVAALLKLLLVKLRVLLLVITYGRSIVEIV